MKIKTALTLTALSLVGAGGAFAATDGAFDTNSTGTTDVTLTVVDATRITGLTDIPLGTYAANDTDGVDASDTFCVHVNGGDTYNITATYLPLTSATTSDTIALQVSLDDDASGAGAEDVNTGGITSEFTGSALIDCGSNDNAYINVEVEDADIRAATTASDYETTVSLLVQPQ